MFSLTSLYALPLKSVSNGNKQITKASGESYVGFSYTQTGSSF